MDYKKLLEAYIAHIIDCEGADFLEFYRAPELAHLSIAEKDELQRIVDSYWKQS